MSKTSITVVAAALCSFAWCQQTNSSWELAVRRYSEARDWNAAMVIVESERTRAPHDIEVLTWRARLLLWSGRLQEAEREWQAVILAAPADPDNWMGLASVYWRQGQPERALQALTAAAKLDSNRPDIHLACARALDALHAETRAEQEYRKALALEPTNTEARAGLLSFRAAPKNRLLIGTNTDFLSFEGAYQQNEVALFSRWTPHWKTGVTGDFYRRRGGNAGKAGATVTASSSGLGSLTVGGTAAHDNGIIPRSEFLFEFDHEFPLPDNPPLRAIEVVYGQHWYWYSTARVMAISETTVLYFRGDWTWSLRIIGSRSEFNRTGPAWSPSGTTKLGFPLINSEHQHPVDGSVFFGVGAENFSQVDQIGSFASRMYGGSLRLQLTALQDLTGYGAYQMRSQNRSLTSFGVTYGLRF